MSPLFESLPLESQPGVALTRRTMLKGVAAALPLALGHSALTGDRPAAPLITRQNAPENLESSFANLDSFITPTPAFYVRNHFATPRLAEKSFRLHVEGEVDRPLDLTMAELRKLGE